MLVEVRLKCKSLIAALTLVMLVGGVCLHVSAEIGAVSEGLPTVCTPIRFLSAVGAHVTLQQPGAGEGLAAHGTLVFEVVGQDVHGECRHGDIDFVTVRALLGTW